MTGPARLRTVRPQSRAFTGVRLPQLGFSGFMRESISAMDGSRWPWTIASNGQLHLRERHALVEVLVRVAASELAHQLRVGHFRK